MGVQYRCPECGAVLPKEPATCPACGAPCHTITIGGLRVLDFLSRQRIFECRCAEHQGSVQCQIVPSQLCDSPPGPKPYHHKAKVLKPYLHYRNKVIVDVGCREGPIGHLLSASNYLIGVDFCPRQVFEGPPNILDKEYHEVLLADANQLPIADEQVDLILVTDLLEHTIIPERVLRECLRVLRPGGQMVVTVPNLVSYNNRLSILSGSGLGIELHRILLARSPINPISGVRYPDQRLHLRFFTRKSLCRTLADEGFRVLRSGGYDPLLSRIPGGDRLFAGLCNLVVAYAQKP